MRARRPGGLLDTHTGIVARQAPPSTWARSWISCVALA
jgi:hypothetical protein